MTPDRRNADSPFLDRLIQALSPSWAVARARSRMMLRAYEGAQTGRRTQGWRTSNSSPVAEVRQGRERLRARSRDLVRNNAWAARALAVKVGHQIGTGIRPRADTPDANLNRLIDEAHARWAADCAPDSGVDLYGMQALAAMAMAESGEALIILDRRLTGGAGRVPLTLQVLEPDWLADATDVKETPSGGWVDGVRFDDAGRRVAYRLWQANPRDVPGLPRVGATREVPATDVVHLFRQTRPGQVRGVPDLAPVIMSLRDLDDYHDAALMLAKVQAVLGAFVTQNGGPTATPLGTETTDADGNRLEELAPGMVAYLQPGEDVKFLAPQGGGPFAEYTRIGLHRAAAGMGVTYHQMTGDLTGANYSSLRAGSLDFRRGVEQDQHLRIIPILCRPIWNAFIAQAILAGVLPREADNAPAKFTPPAFSLVDPGRDTEAIKAQVRAGLMTWPEAVAEMGYDANDQLEEIKAFNDKLRKAGVVLDTDPRLVTANGQPVNSPAVAATVLSSE